LSQKTSMTTYFLYIASTKIKASFSKLSQSNVKVYLFVFRQKNQTFFHVKQINFRAKLEINSI